MSSSNAQAAHQDLFLYVESVSGMNSFVAEVREVWIAEGAPAGA